MKTKLGWTLVATLLVLTGCSNDENETIDNWNGEIRLVSGVTVQQTRTNSIGVPDTQIAASQQVKVVVAKQDGDAKDYAGYTLDFIADGEGGLSNTTTMYYPASGMGVSIYAYHPSNAATTENFSVQENQSADNDYYQSDLLYSAKKGYSRQKAAHSLRFVHKLCKVEYKLEQGTGTPDLTGATVQWLNVAKTIGFTPETGAVATPADKVTALTPHATCGAIIVPQTVASGTRLLLVTLANGGKLYYTPDTDQVFETGKKYMYTITVNLSGLSVKSEIEDWESVGDPRIGNAEME